MTQQIRIHHCVVASSGETVVCWETSPLLVKGSALDGKWPEGGEPFRRNRWTFPSRGFDDDNNEKDKTRPLASCWPLRASFLRKGNDRCRLWSASGLLGQCDTVQRCDALIRTGDNTKVDDTIGVCGAGARQRRGSSPKKAKRKCWQAENYHRRADNFPYRRPQTIRRL